MFWAQFALLAQFSPQHRQELPRLLLLGRQELSKITGRSYPGYAVLFLLMLTALQELGKQDFLLLLFLEQKVRSSRGRKKSRQVWHGRNNPAALLPREMLVAEIRIHPMSSKAYHISSCCPLLLCQLLCFQIYTCYPNSLSSPECLLFQ